MIREHPEPLFHGHVLGGVGLEDRSEDSGLDPSCVKLRIGLFDTFRLHMTAYVMAPVAVASVGSSSGEIRKIAEHLPCSVCVTRETDLIAVAADASPTVVYHRTRS